MESGTGMNNVMYKKTKMCAFFTTSGCYHGSACGYAHDLSELQPAVDLRKTTLCINYTRGRCSLSDCRFAHGVHDLRQFPEFPVDSSSEENSVIGDDWFPADCPETPEDFQESIQKLKLVLELALPKRVGKVISLDEGLGSTETSRQRLDLFPHLDFANEVLIEESCQSLLMSISSEVQRFLETDMPLLADGDHSLWTLPH